MLKAILKHLHKLFLALCRVVTRAECHEARAQVAETMRWADMARARRSLAERQFHEALTHR